MKKLGYIILVLSAALMTFAASARPIFPSGRHIESKNCQSNLAQSIPETEEGEHPGYANSDEQDRRRFEEGPDETEERNPDERDAMDPGGF